MKKLLPLLIIFSVFLFTTSCIYDKGELATPDSGCDTSYYTLQIKPIIDNNCISCHVQGGQSQYDFTTYAGLKPFLDDGRVKNSINIIDQNDPLYMPLGSALDPTDFAKLNDWLDAGHAGCD